MNDNDGILDILILSLKPGCRFVFDKAYKELSLPMLRRWNVDVIAYGPSMQEEDTYLVVRRYKDIADRQQSQDAYYGSDEWKLGSREQIMSLIENYTSVVIPANKNLVEGFKILTGR
jgi:hypothetical protein